MPGTIAVPSVVDTWQGTGREMVKKPTNITRSRVQRAVNKMPAPLRAQYVALQSLLSRATSSEVLARYEVGLVVTKVMTAEKKYGTGAVGLLSRALGRDQSFLYRAADVARTWSKREMAILIRRKNVYGEPLSWSHLIELSKVISKDERDQLIERALDHGLSVRDMMASRRVDVPDVATVGPGTGGQRAAASGLREMVAMSDAIARKAEAWQSDVFDALLASSESPTPEIQSLLEKARMANDEIVKVAGDNLDKIQRLLKGPAARRRSKKAG